MSTLTHPDLFTSVELTQSVNKLPLMPLRMGRLFSEQGVRTTSVSLELIKGRLVLVENQDRRDPAKHLAERGTKRTRKILPCCHLPLADTIASEDIQNIQDFGTTVLIGPEAVVNDRMQTLKNSIEMTREFHRLGAIKGVVCDADGVTVLYDLFEVFGVEQKKIDITFPGTNSVKDDPIKNAILAGKRHAEQNLGGLPASRFEALVGANFYDKLTGHQLVRDAFNMWMSNQANFGDNDYRSRGFPWGGVTWLEASESVNGRALVDADKAHMYPVAPGLFQTFNAPANWMEAANTVGIPFYALMESLRMGRGYEIEVQSNPLCLCTYPETLVEFTAK